MIRLRWPRRRRGLIWLGAGLAAVTAIVVGLGVAYPSVAAITCPRCFGLEKMDSGVYVERGIPAAGRQRVGTALAEAKRRVGDFYGGRKSSPRVLACLTADCYQRIGGGGERGIAILNRAVMLSPRGIDAVIAAHELSHVELHVRLDGHDGRIPHWFNEGLAVLVSADARYLREPGAGADRCRIAPAAAEKLPETLADWLGAVGGEQLYAKAACLVSRWVDANGGRRAILDLIDRVNAGESFATVTGG